MLSLNIQWLSVRLSSNELPDPSASRVKASVGEKRIAVVKIVALHNITF